MNNIAKTKFTHKTKVFIKMGYYRGYKATIIDYKLITDSSELIPKTEVFYKLMIEGVGATKEEFWFPEETLLKYRKYILF